MRRVDGTQSHRIVYSLPVNKSFGYFFDTVHAAKITPANLSKCSGPRTVLISQQRCKRSRALAVISLEGDSLRERLRSIELNRKTAYPFFIRF